MGHKVDGYLDLSDDGEIDYSKDGMYSTQFFVELTQQRIRDHKAGYPDTPLFLYVPMQNVHSPNEAPAAYVADAGCAQVTNSEAPRLPFGRAASATMRSSAPRRCCPRA